MSASGSKKIGSSGPGSRPTSAETSAAAVSWPGADASASDLLVLPSPRTPPFRHVASNLIGQIAGPGRPWLSGEYTMKTRSTIVALLITLAVGAAPLVSQVRPAHPVIVSSPDGRTHTELSTADGILHYRVIVDGNQMLASSRLGIESDDVELGQDVTLGSAKPHGGRALSLLWSACRGGQSR